MANSTASRKIRLFSSIPFHKESGLPLYQQIANSITEAISSSQVASRMKLPSIRNLAQELQVNPDTVKRAYRRLVEEGFIVSKKGSGFSVADT